MTFALESPFASEGFAGASFNETPGESFDTLTYESEWGSPFGEAFENESFATESSATENYQSESFTPENYAEESEWGSPFGKSEEGENWTESEISKSLTFATNDKDVTYRNQQWRFGKNEHATNKEPRKPEAKATRVEWHELTLSYFDVDQYFLKSAHRQAIKELAAKIKAGIDAGRYSRDTITLRTYGATSTTASDQHNMALSRHRAFNTLNAMRFALQQAGITNPIHSGFFPIGEEEARADDGQNNVESGFRRQVIVRVFAPLAAPVPCSPQKPCPPHVPCRNCNPPGQSTSSKICVSVVHISPRSTLGLPPDVVPLGPLVPGLRLPFALVLRAKARIAVDDQTSRKQGSYEFVGWGLEVALPTGRTVIDIRADLEVSLKILASAAASLSAKLKLGPLGLVLRIDVDAFAQLIVKLVAQLRARITIDLGRPNVPELLRCTPIDARSTPRGFDFDALTGSALLVVPGRGFGPSLVSFAGSRVPSTGMPGGLIAVPADKSSVKTLLALGGTLRLSRTAARPSAREDESSSASRAYEQPQHLGQYAEAHQSELYEQFDQPQHYDQSQQFDHGFEQEDHWSSAASEAGELESFPTYEQFAAELAAFH